MAQEKKPSDMVAIRHKSAKKSDPVAVTSRKAYEQVWKDKGWNVIERGEVDSATPTTGTGPSE